MNQTLKTIESRYTCRNYDGCPVEREKLDAIALTAVQAPSAMNRQPWEIVVITDKALIDEMDAEAMNALAEREDKTMYERIKERGGKIFYNAPCVFIVNKMTDTGSNWVDLDCGIVTQNIALAAESLGLGNCICAMMAIPLNGANGAKYKNKLNITEGREFGMAVLVGHAAAPGTPHTPNMEKVKFI
ncbi:MAG: nitroreductase [Defluviitaleaceae bacterium]|nr:nitroreductase [Defluviitaleaceae bacterium]